MSIVEREKESIKECSIHLYYLISVENAKPVILQYPNFEFSLVSSCIISQESSRITMHICVMIILDKRLRNQSPWSISCPLNVSLPTSSHNDALENSKCY